MLANAFSKMYSLGHNALRTNSHLLYIFELVACGFDSGFELMLGLVANAMEDIGDLRSPHFRVIFATSCLDIQV